MKACPQHYIDYMHDYLDGDITREHEQELKKHMQNCASCQKHMHELSDAVAFVKRATNIVAPPSFEASVMSRLPKRKNALGFQKLLRRHPIIVAAAVFLILTTATIMASYPNDNQFSVTTQPNLVVEGQTVIVPKGEVVQGDVIVKNGNLIIEGEVDGNVTVINGSYMASTAVVSGQIEEINEAFDWLWYKVKKSANDFLALFK